MRIVLLMCVAIFCFSWVTINLSHDAVKNRELDVQVEMARAIAKYGRPSLSIEPSDESGSRESRRKEKL